MNIYIKIWKLYRQHKQLWQSRIGFGKKLLFIPNILVSYLMFIATRKKSVTYLGTKVEYDNIATPLILQRYPYEITRQVLPNIEGDIRTVLDLGANIGQFAITLSAILNHEPVIHSFEPNPAIYKTLYANTCGLENIHTYNLGISSKKTTTLSFAEGKSAIGSYFKENAGNHKHIKSLVVQNTNDIHATTGISKFDLIKIDVEGYEYELLKAMKEQSTKYLFIEISGTGRYKNYNHSEIYQLIYKKLGAFDIVYQTSSHLGCNNFEVLFKFL